MGSIKERSGLLCLFAALLVSLAWPCHAAAADRTMADFNCQESVLICASELNSDCGNSLLESPANFVFVEPGFMSPPAGIIPVPVFHGRAPPAV
jgi:hypothetical protein